MTGYDAFLVYQGIKLHFTTDSYDYIKYNRTYRCSMETFDKRKDKYSFHKLARKFGTKEELEFFVASVFLSNPKAWVGELNGDAMHDLYLHHRKIKESLEYRTIDDLGRIGIRSVDDLKKALTIDELEDGYPPLLRSVMCGEIELETLIAIDVLTNCFDSWAKQVQDTIIFPKWKLRLQRYLPFMDVDKKNLSHQIKEYLSQDK